VAHRLTQNRWEHPAVHRVTGATAHHRTSTSRLLQYFQYSNLGYFVVSLVAERVSGQGWAEFTRRALTDKLHMDVTFTVEELAAAADAAVPYAMEGDTLLRSKLWPVSVTAAGGMSTSIASIANWLRFQGAAQTARRLNRNSGRICPRPPLHRGRASFATVRTFGRWDCINTVREKGRRSPGSQPARPFSRPQPPADRRQSAGLIAYSFRVHC
jgi:CubicO group peptidase (beta-lactamase class C family)